MNRDLFKPILDGGVQSVSFFTGRLLTAQDLTDEQSANQRNRRRLGRAVGAGVVSGLLVDEAIGPSSRTAPVVRVTAGEAVNRLGQTLALTADIDLALVRPAGAPLPPIVSAFGDCGQVEGGSYASGDGVYLLTLAPADGTAGLAQVSGLGNAAAGCNTGYRVEGVQFRFVPLDLSGQSPTDTARLRNRIAYACLGSTPVTVFHRNPFAALPERYGLIDSLRPNRLGECEVPLAVVHLAAGQGLRYVDMWSARRRLMDPSIAGRWNGVIGDRRLSEAEAAFLQFQDQASLILTEAGVAPGLAADARFVYLPPAAFLPVGTGRFNWRTFLGPHAPPAATQVDEGLLTEILHEALFCDPVPINAFADASRPNVAPPIPVEVYQAPGQAGFVLFARSNQGRVRVFLSPAPTASQTTTVTHSSIPASSTGTASPEGGGLFVFPGVPAGAYRIAVAAQGFQPVSPVNTAAVDGRTTDVVIAIQPLPRGQILLSVTDLKSKPIGRSVTQVRATAGSTTVTGTRQSDDRWLLANLLDGSYDITVVASSYKTGALSGVAVGAGQVVERTIQLAPDKQRRPPLCTEITDVKQPVISRARLCMSIESCSGDKVIYADAFAASSGLRMQLSAATIAGGQTEGATKAGRAIHQMDSDWWAADEWDMLGQTERDDSMFILGGGGRPWDYMIPVQPLPIRAAKWLAEWKTWFDAEYPGQGIGDSLPAIFINPEYTPPLLVGDVPDRPQAYAVFGEFGVPLTANLLSNTTRRPVRVSKAGLKGLSDGEIRALEGCGLVYVDQIAGAWAELLADVLGRPIDYVRYLIDDTIRIIHDINEKKKYYDIEQDAQKVLDDLDLEDDVAIANVPLDKLGDALKDMGLARRLIQQARDVLPKEGWSLSILGLTPGQVTTLEAIKVTSLGELAAMTGAARGEVAAALGIKHEPEKFVADLQATAITAMTTSSIRLAPVVELAALPGINADYAGKLAEAGYTSPEALAGAKPDEVAAKTGLPLATITGLIAEAGAVERGTLSVSKLAHVTGENAAALKGLGVNQASDLVGKSAAEIAPALGGDLALAAALLNGVNAGLGQIGK